MKDFKVGDLVYTYNLKMFNGQVGCGKVTQVDEDVLLARCIREDFFIRKGYAFRSFREAAEAMIEAYCTKLKKDL